MTTHRSIFILLFVVMTVSCWVTVCTAKDDNRTNPPHRILKSASELDYPPFAIVREDGSADGFSVDLLKSIVKAVGLDINFTVGPWAEIKQELVDGHIDVLPFVSYSKEREKVYGFTAPYLRMHGTIFIRQGEKSIKSEADLKGKEVLVMRGDTAHEYAVKKNLSDKMILTDSFEDAMRLLSDGNHDAVIIQKLVGLQLINKLNISNLVSFDNITEVSLKPGVKPLSGFEQKFCIATQDDDKELQALLNEGLAIVIANGTYNDLYDKWFGPILPKPSVPLSLILKYLAFILGPVLFFLAVVGVWYLKKEVARKTNSLREEIIERKKAEEALRESEERLRIAGKAAYDLIYEWNVFNDELEWFGDIDGLLGYEPGAISRDIVAWLDLIHPEDRGQLENAVELHRTATEPIRYEYRIKHRDGTYRSLQDHGLPMLDKQGRPYKWIGVCADITERTRAEEELRESEEKYRSLVESTQDSIYVVNRNCTYLFMNKRHLSRLDVPEDNATGKTYREFHSASDTQEFFNKVDEVFAIDAPLQHEHESHRDGKHFLRTLSPIIGPDGRTEAVTVVSTDITDRVQAEEERLKLEAQLHRAQKMEAMGLLAGGVAHDLNNILSGIVSYPELLLVDLPEDSPLRKPIKTIQESGMRAAAVVDDLLTLARGVATGKEALNLNTILSEYLESPEYQKLDKTHSFVNFKTELDPDLLNMSGSPIHIKKILMNLVNNASEAIEGAGTVTISSMNRYLDEPLKGYAAIRTGEYAVLSVSDDGSGIAPKDLAKIFEPFYTQTFPGLYECHKKAI